ncbi:hypothetical protein [Streptomyces sp. NPDC059349]|uniref:hypothetical protein n=1 Tax=Streptomyces sp. NPDC059349 TaxID=3346808 RepID=UPI003673DC15
MSTPTVTFQLARLLPRTLGPFPREDLRSYLGRLAWANAISATMLTPPRPWGPGDRNAQDAPGSPPAHDSGSG